MRYHPKFFVVAICLVVGAFWAFSSQLLAQQLEVEPAGRPMQVQPSPVAAESLVFRPISFDEVVSIGEQLPLAGILDRYTVPVEMARRVARGYVLERGYLTEGLTECLYLPKLDSEGHILGHFFLFSSLSECADFSALVEFASAVAAQARDEMDMATATSAWQHRAHELTAEQFYSVTISGYRFKPPLELGHQGLPLFLLDSAGRPADCLNAPRPEAIVLAHEDTVYEAVQYECNGGTVLYSHYAEREMAADEVLQIDLEGTLAGWRVMVLDPVGPGEPALMRLNERWMRYLDAGSGNTTEQEQ